jgi:uncharacterized protein YPO0396
MQLKSLVNAKVATLAVAGLLVAGGAGAGTAVAAKQITTNDIKDGTIQTRDLTKNNFARFTSTETVVTSDTPVSADPALGGARVVALTPNAETNLATITLNKGTWKLTGTAQFWHKNGAGQDGYGRVTVPGLQSGQATSYSGVVPNGGQNAAQTQFQGTIKITQNNTPVVITGSISGNTPAGQAGVSVTATQYEYVKLFSGGQ